MKRTSFDLSWSHIYMTWKSVLGCLGADAESEVSFLEIGRSEALPISLPPFAVSERMLVPADEDDLMLICALEAALVIANWQLVRFVIQPTVQLHVVQ